MTVLFLLHFLCVINGKLRHFRLTQFLGCWRAKCDIFSLDVFKTYAVFSHGDRQLSWRLYIFERDMQFWYTKIGNFHDDFIFLIEWCHFLTDIRTFLDDFMTWTRYAIFIGWIFCIFQVPYEKKRIVPVQAAHFPWPETTKIRKLPKVDLGKNSATATKRSILM